MHEAAAAESAHAGHRHQAVTHRRPRRSPLRRPAAPADVADRGDRRCWRSCSWRWRSPRPISRVHYLIDQGESSACSAWCSSWSRACICIGSGRLVASLPLVFPWLLFPVITQGDQIIDNLSINWMRIVVHVLLAAIFAMPVAVDRLRARDGWMKLSRPRDSREPRRSALLRDRDRGWRSCSSAALMIVTLIVMIALRAGCSDARDRRADAPSAVARRSAVALAVLVGGVTCRGACISDSRTARAPIRAARASTWIRRSARRLSPRSHAGADAAHCICPSGVDDLTNRVDGLRATPANGCSTAITSSIATTTITFTTSCSCATRRCCRTTGARAWRSSNAAREQRAALDDSVTDACHLGQRQPAGRAARRRARLRGLHVRPRCDARADERASSKRRRPDCSTPPISTKAKAKFLGVQLAALLDKHRAVLAAPAARPIVGRFVLKSRGASKQSTPNRIVGF